MGYGSDYLGRTPPLRPQPPRALLRALPDATILILSLLLAPAAPRLQRASAPAAAA